MSNYSRQNKETNKDSQETGKASHHIKKGLSAFQKTLTLIGSMLGIITATITISHAMKSNEQKKADTSPVTQTTIIKEIQKESPAQSNAPAQNQGSNQDTNAATSGVDHKNDNKVQPEENTQAPNNVQQNQTEELLNLIQLPQIIKQIHNKIASLRFRKEAIFYCCKTFRGFVPSAGPITPANSNSSINRVARLNPTERRR